MCIKTDLPERIKVTEMADTPKVRLCFYIETYAMLAWIFVMLVFPAWFVKNELLTTHDQFVYYTSVLASGFSLVAVDMICKRIRRTELDRLKSQSIDEGARP